MSSLSSVFNSCSTLITWDVYKKLNPDASERRLVLVGQLSTAVLVVLGILWIPLMDLIADQLYVYLQSVQGYISPPIAAVFLIGIAWRRANARGAMAALLTGFVLGALRFILELNKGALDGFLFTFADINFLHFSTLLFLICAAVLVAVSVASPAPSDAKVAGLTFATTTGELGPKTLARTMDFALSGVLVLCVLAIWWYFSA